jgi:hypothetical protein
MIAVVFASPEPIEVPVLPLIEVPEQPHFESLD